MLVAGILGAQEPSTKPGTVEGSVTNAVTGEPLKKATVTLRRDNPPAVYQALADAAGHFHFDNVEPGRYGVSASRDGFMEQPLNRRSLSGVGQNKLAVAEEQHIRDVAMTLLPLGTVSGRVLDEDGDPLIRATVQTVEYSYNLGKKQLNPQGGSAITNDLGEYQITGLQPGRYYVQTIVQPRMPNLPPRTRWSRPEEAYPVTLYPNARDPGQATAIQVAAGTQLTNIDFRLHKARAYHIRGKVVDESAAPADMHTVSVMILAASGWTGYAPSAQLQLDGTFDARGIVDGSYVVMARRRMKGAGAIARQSVTVADQDVNGIVLALASGLEIPGTVKVEGAPPDTISLQISLGPSSEELGDPANATVARDGGFVIHGVLPDVYQVNVLSPPKGKYVKSIRFGERDATNGQIDLTGRTSAVLSITLGGDGGQIDGSVQTPGGDPAPEALVTVWPTEEYERRLDMFYIAISDQNGKFRLQDLAPGRYQAFAWESPDQNMTYETEFRKPFESRSASLSIAPAGHESIQLTLISSDDIEKEKSKLP
jgi:hypothetical protein